MAVAIFISILARDTLYCFLIFFADEYETCTKMLKTKEALAQRLTESRIG
jgi:hypothetical protein